MIDRVIIVVQSKFKQTQIQSKIQEEHKMKYYVGYFNKPWDKSEFTVICACPRKAAACFILDQYQNHPNSTGDYEMISAADAMDLKLIF